MIPLTLICDALPSEKVVHQQLENNTTDDVPELLKKLDSNNNDIPHNKEDCTIVNTPDSGTVKSKAMSSNESRVSSDYSHTPPINFPTKAKELFTSFSRSFNSSTLSALPCGGAQFNPKLGSVFENLSALTTDTSKGFNLPNFIVAGILSNLKSLGVEEIDGKEHVESWLSQRRQRRWKESLGHKTFNFLKNESPDSYSCFQDIQGLLGVRSSATELSSRVDKETSDTLTVFSPSQPNSSLMRLTGDGNVKMGKFLGTMEEMREHFNNATCTILQSTIVLNLPYLKLRSGDQLENTCCQTFINQWIHLIRLMSQDLKLESRKDVDIMLGREFRTLRVESFQLYKRLGKLHRKVTTLLSEIKGEIEPALVRLQPKKLPAFRGRRGEESNGNGKPKDPSVRVPMNTTLEEKVPVPIIPKFQLPPVPLARANTTTDDLYKNHVFFSKSRKGHLVYRYDTEDKWKRFSDISFNNRRELFLYVIDDLHSTLKLSYNIAEHVKELFIPGYPECVEGKILDNLKYLKDASKDSSLLVLSKVTITTQVKSLRSSLSRLEKTLRIITGISKSFFKNIKPSLHDSSGGATSLWKMKSGRSSSKTKKTPCNTEEARSLPFDNWGVQLLIPYPNSTNPFVDQFFTASME